jgi:hypothetical protein
LAQEREVLTQARGSAIGVRVDHRVRVVELEPLIEVLRVEIPSADELLQATADELDRFLGHPMQYHRLAPTPDRM